MDGLGVRGPGSPAHPEALGFATTVLTADASAHATLRPAFRHLVAVVTRVIATQARRSPRALAVLKQARRATTKATLPMTNSDWQLEAWIQDPMLPAPSARYVTTLIGHAQRLAGPRDPPMVRDRDILDFCAALLSRKTLGWPVARRLWAHYPDAASRSALLAQGNLATDGPWWREVDFATAAISALEQLTSTARDEVCVFRLEHRLIRHVLLNPAIRWPNALTLRTMLWLADSQSPTTSVVPILQYLETSPHWQPTADELLPLLSSRHAGLRIWAHLQIARVVPSALASADVSPPATATGRVTGRRR